MEAASCMKLSNDSSMTANCTACEFSAVGEYPVDAISSLSSSLVHFLSNQRMLRLLRYNSARADGSIGHESIASCSSSMKSSSVIAFLGQIASQCPHLKQLYGESTSIAFLSSLMARWPRMQTLTHWPQPMHDSEILRVLPFIVFFLPSPFRDTSLFNLNNVHQWTDKALSSLPAHVWLSPWKNPIPGRFPAYL